MFKKGIKLASAISLVALGVSAIASCGKNTVNPIHFVGLNESNAIDVKVDAAYTVSLTLDKGYETGVITWSSNAQSKVVLDGNNSSVSITVNEVGSYIVTASLNLEGSILENSFIVNATRGEETYALKAEINGKTNYKQGEAFLPQGLSVKKVKSVDGNPTKNIVELSSSEYTLSVAPGTILTEVGEKEIEVIPHDTTIAKTSFKISVELEPGYLLGDIMSQIGENYTAFSVGEEGKLEPIYAINEEYYFDYSLEEGYYLDNGEVTRYSIDYVNSTKDNIIFQKRNKVSDGFNRDGSVHYSTSLEYPMAALGYTHAKNVEYSTKDVLAYDSKNELFSISSGLASQFLGVFGWDFLTLNLEVYSAELMSTALQFTDGSTTPLILIHTVFSQNGQPIGGLTFGISLFEMSGEPIVDEFIADENKSINAEIDAEVQMVKDVIASNSFTGRYGESSDGSYSTISVDESSTEWYEHSVSNDDSSMGLIKIPEGKEVTAGVYTYEIVSEDEISVDTSKSLSEANFDFFRPSNWYGYASEGSALGVTFDEMWLLSGYYPGDATQKDPSYVKYTLYHQGIAEAWSQQAFLYSDSFISTLASKHGYSFVAISFYLLDTDFNGSYDQINLALECTTTTISGYAGWDTLSLDSASIGEYTNSKVSAYLASITPAAPEESGESGEIA